MCRGTFFLTHPVCYQAACQNDHYKSHLLKTGQNLLIEAVPGQTAWGSGLSHYATQHTRLDKLPGNNKMGNILMHVRSEIADKLLREYEENQHEALKEYDENEGGATAYHEDTVCTQNDTNDAVIYENIPTSNRYSVLDSQNEEQEKEKHGFGGNVIRRGKPNTSHEKPTRGRGRAKRNLSGRSTSPQPSQSKTLHISLIQGDSMSEKQFEDAQVSTPDDTILPPNDHKDIAHSVNATQDIFPDEEFW